MSQGRSTISRGSGEAVSGRRSVVGDLGAVGRAPGGKSNMALATMNSDSSATSEGEQADSTLPLPVASTSPTSTWTSVSVAGAFGAVAMAGGCFSHAVAINVATGKYVADKAGRSTRSYEVG